MLIYLPIWIYVRRRDFRSTKLYLIPHAIVYKATKPIVSPCFGVLKNGKDVILPSVSGIVVEQVMLLLAVLVHLLSARNLNFSRKAFASNDHRSTSSNPANSSSVPLGYLILEKLEDVEISLKKM